MADTTRKAHELIQDQTPENINKDVLFCKISTTKNPNMLRLQWRMSETETGRKYDELITTILKAYGHKHMTGKASAT